jgi:hypothetical protein
MTWRWRYEDQAGAAVGAGLAAEVFPSQADAETWLGETWRELLAGGVDQVSLLEDDRVVYGPMSLHPAE